MRCDGCNSSHYGTNDRGSQGDIMVMGSTTVVGKMERKGQIVLAGNKVGRENSVPS